MTKTAKILVAFLAIVIVASMFVLVGCTDNGNNGDDTTATSTNEGDESSKTTDSETEQTTDIDVTNNDSFELSTSKANLVLKIENNKPYIVSLKTNKGYNFIQDEPSEISLPTLPAAVTYTSASTYTGERGEKGYKFTFKGTNVRLELYVSATESFAGPFEFWGYIYNDGTSTAEYSPSTYFDTDLTFEETPTATVFKKESGAAEGWTIYSGWGVSGSGIYETYLKKSATASATYTTNQDWNAGGDISMMYVDTGTRGVYFAQEWSNGKITAKGKSNDVVGLSAIIGSKGFYTEIPSGESLYLPSIYLGVFDGDMDDGANDYKRWFLNCKAPENMISNAIEPLTQQDMQIGSNVSKYGIQSIKWDYGWWSDEGSGSWKTNEGLLEVHAQGYLAAIGASKKNTDKQIMTALTNFCRRAGSATNGGVKVAVYVLLKDTQLDKEGVPTSVGQYGHPEWFSNRCVTGVGNSADLGNKECVEFYKQYMANFFTTSKVTTWRSDFEPICRSSNQTNRHTNETDVQYWCTIGFTELVDYLIENVEGFRYESCSSGGSMKDIYTMTKASVINCDDSADYMSLHMSFYDSSYCIHPAQLQLPINSLTYTSGSQYYTGTADYIYGLRTQLTGAVMLSNWKGTNNGGIDETSYWETVVANDYNKIIKPLMKYGDMYHILPRPDGVNWDGLQYVNLNSSIDEKAVVMLWKPTNNEGNTKTVKLRGLDSDTLYNVRFTDHTDQNCQKTGAELMNDGLTVVFTESVASDFIYLTVAQ